MNRLLYIFLVIILIQFCACSSSSEYPQAYWDFKDYVLIEENEVCASLLFFNVDEKSKLGYIEADALNNTLHYDEPYKGKDIELLYKEMMTGKYVFSCQEIKCFTPDENILSAYKQIPFEDFKKRYTYKSEYTSREVIEYRLEYNQSLTVAYCLFLNGYYTDISCEDGSFSILKWNK